MQFKVATLYKLSMLAIVVLSMAPACPVPSAAQGAPDDVPIVEPKPRPKPKSPPHVGSHPVSPAPRSAAPPSPKDDPARNLVSERPGPPTGRAVEPSAGAPSVPDKPVHALEGIWKFYWIDQNKVTELRVGQVSPLNNVTNLVGSFVSLDGQSCPMTGSVVDSLSGSFIDGLETKAQQIFAYVVIHGQCPDRQIWIEGFGLPRGRILISGRATAILSSGTRDYSAIGLGR